MAWSSSARHGTNWKPRGYAKLRTKVFAAHGNRCVDCGSPHQLELDHVNGDRNDWVETNLAPRCRPCHAVKTSEQAVAARARRRARLRRPPEQHPGLRP